MAVRYSADAGHQRLGRHAPPAGGRTYEIETSSPRCNTVANETKHMDPSYITNGNNITQAFIDYAQPLVGTLPEVGTFDELKMCPVPSCSTDVDAASRHASTRGAPIASMKVTPCFTRPA